MAFQTLTMVDVLEGIRQREYFLPAIQREFVWEDDQIERLFDSLMREYPIGSFLFWKVKPETIPKFQYYEFMRDFHRRDAIHNPVANVPTTHAVTVILDGQQRLTALNIGLQGSHAEKVPRLRWSNDEAFPIRHLYLDIFNVNSTAGVEDLMYTFRFLEDHVAKKQTEQGDRFWFPVQEIMRLPENRELRVFLQEMGLPQERIWDTWDSLERLQFIVHREPAINYFLEGSQDIDKVLNIFIRVNQGGTTLSYSDLLLSVATAQWTVHNARQEIHSLVDNLNRTGHGFSFTKDRVLKASLVLGGFGDIKFKAANFDQDNMSQIEEKWDGIKRALQTAVKLLADFGYSRETLTSENVLIPVAYYAQKRQLDDPYINGTKHAEDRNRVRSWVTRSLLKGSIWTGAVDAILTKTREIIDSSGASGFPLAEIEKAMARQGKGLVFEDPEIEDIAELAYGNRRAYTALSLLYPAIDVRREFHVDHIFPRKLFKKRSLRAAGVAESLIDEYQARVNQLPNLQLLEGPYNQEKSDLLPHAWLERQYSDEAARNHYREIHDLQDLPVELVGFLNFFEQRRKRLEEKLERLLTA